MKVTENRAFFIGAKTQEAEQDRKAEDTKKNPGSIAAGSLNKDLFENKLLAKKKEAQEKALKVVGEAWESDKVIDEDLQGRRDKIAALSEENQSLQKEIAAIEEQQAALDEQFGIDPEGQDAKDLALLRKYDGWRTGTPADITEEDLKRLGELQESGLSDYVARQRELDEQKNHFAGILEENKQMILEENAIIRGTKMERLKHHAMVDARKEAEAIKDAAGKEILAMAMQEGKEHVDAEMEEEQEKAEKLEEEQEKKEEFIEARKEKNKEAEELLEDMPMEELINMGQLKTEVQQEVKKIISDMKLVAEDIKGAMVDKGV